MKQVEEKKAKQNKRMLMKATWKQFSDKMLYMMIEKQLGFNTQIYMIVYTYFRHLFKM